MSIAKELKTVQNTLNAMNMTDIQRYPENYETLSVDAALQCEQIACRLRHLVYAIAQKPKAEYLESAAKAQGINITLQDGILELDLPGLVPKRNKWKSAEFLLEPLTAAISRYAQEQVLPQYRSCTVCFTHVYDSRTADWAIRDADNMELKRYLDVVASFFLADDNGLLCDSYITSELGKRSHTLITLMERRRFPGWVNERLSGAEFYRG